MSKVQSHKVKRRKPGSLAKEFEEGRDQVIKSLQIKNLHNSKPMDKMRKTQKELNAHFKKRQTSGPTPEQIAEAKKRIAARKAAATAAAQSSTNNSAEQPGGGRRRRKSRRRRRKSRKKSKGRKRTKRRKRRRRTRRRR